MTGCALKRGFLHVSAVYTALWLAWKCVSDATDAQKSFVQVSDAGKRSQFAHCVPQACYEVRLQNVACFSRHKLPG